MLDCHILYSVSSNVVLLLLVFFSVHASLVTIKRRNDAPARTFCAPALVPILGAATWVALMPFVPAGSLLTAAIILLLGGALVVLRRPAART